MRDPDNIRKVAQLDINWMGFIFYPKSPRFINCQSKFEDPPNCQIKKVGVFVNATPGQLMETASVYQLDYLQLHGNEPPELCHALYKRGYQLIKAFSIETSADLHATAGYEGKVDYFLFDTKCAGYGGSGQSFDWSVLENYKGDTPFLLSGGIRPESGPAIRAFQHPQFAGIDLNSGFEYAPAQKNIQQLADFIREIKSKTT